MGEGVYEEGDWDVDWSVLWWVGEAVGPESNLFCIIYICNTVCLSLSVRQRCVWCSPECAVGERQEEISWSQSSCRLPEGEESVCPSVVISFPVI